MIEDSWFVRKEGWFDYYERRKVQRREALYVTILGGGTGFNDVY